MSADKKCDGCAGAGVVEKHIHLPSTASDATLTTDCPDCRPEPVPKIAEGHGAWHWAMLVLDILVAHMWATDAARDFAEGRYGWAAWNAAITGLMIVFGAIDISQAMSEIPCKACGWVYWHGKGGGKRP